MNSLKWDVKKLTEFKSDSPQLQGVHLNIYTGTAGPLAGLGHNVKFRCKDFSLFFDGNNLKLGIFKASSLTTVCAVDSRKTPSPKPVPPGDKTAIETNMFSKAVLDVEKYPDVFFEVTKEEGKKTVAGTLHLRGVAKDIDMVIEEYPQHFAVKSSIDQRKFGMVPYSAMMGALQVAAVVDVEILFPKTVYKDGNWWF